MSSIFVTPFSNSILTKPLSPQRQHENVYESMVRSNLKSTLITLIFLAFLVVVTIAIVSPEGKEFLAGLLGWL